MGELHKLGIDEVVTAPRRPWQNSFVERLIGSVRRECLYHLIVLDERHLKRSYKRYYYHWRTHRVLARDSPNSRPMQSPRQGNVVEFPEVGGLHHHYKRLAA